MKAGGEGRMINAAIVGLGASALSLLINIAVVTVTSPSAQTRSAREEAKVVRSIYFPVPISILIIGS